MPSSILPNNRDTFVPPEEERLAVSRVVTLALGLAVVLAAIFGSYRLYRTVVGADRLTRPQRYLALQEEAGRRNCVLFTYVAGFPSRAEAARALRLVESTVAAAASVERSATAITGEVQTPQGRAYVVASAAEVCWDRAAPSPAAVGGV